MFVGCVQNVVDRLALVEDDEFISVYGYTWKLSYCLTIFHHVAYILCCCATIVIDEYCHLKHWQVCVHMIL